MKIPEISIGQVRLIQTVMIAGGVVFIFYQMKKATAVVSENAEQVINSTRQFIAEDINPASSENFINRGFNWFYKKIPGTGESLGSDIYDWTHTDEGIPATFNKEDL